MIRENGPLPSTGTELNWWDPSDLEELGALGRRREYRKGEVLFLEGDRSDRVVVIHSGNVKVLATSDEGQEVLLGVRGAGEVIGEISVLDDEPRSASAYALETVDARVIAASRYLEFLQARPDVMLAQIRTMTARLRESDGKRLELSAYSTERRLAKRLVELADSHGEMTPDGIRIGVNLSQDELGGWTGASREAVARALRRFRDAGLVTTNRREIVVTDLPGLTQRADW